MIVAIDGPAGSGKSTVAKEAAARLGFHYLDTGAMYRAVAFAALDEGIALDDEARLAQRAKTLPLTFGFAQGEVLPSQVFLGDRDITRAIRTPEIDTAVSPVSAHPAVREALVALQRTIAGDDNYVVEGRDIGTAVFPDAPVKLFITASAQERAHRRALQNEQRGMNGSYEEVYQAILARDKADSTRAVAPLVPADDALVIDTTDLELEEVIARVVEIVTAVCLANMQTEQTLPHPFSSGEARA